MTARHARYATWTGQTASPSITTRSATPNQVPSVHACAQNHATSRAATSTAANERRRSVPGDRGSTTRASGQSPQAAQLTVIAAMCTVELPWAGCGAAATTSSPTAPSASTARPAAGTDRSPDATAR